MRVLVVGAGFTGLSAARVLAEAGHWVNLIDKRRALGGNAADELRDGLHVSTYGPHLFHTNSDKIFEFLSRFTEWRKYEHHVASVVDGKIVPMPITFGTLNALFAGENIEDEVGMRTFLEREKVKLTHVRNSRDQLLATVGPRIAQALFLGYTEKQWGLSAEELDARVVSRIPIRYNDDRRYFTDSYQCLPREGYDAMFRRMADHPNIWHEQRSYRSDLNYKYDKIIHTGCIDEFYEHLFGQLGYRSLGFSYEEGNVMDEQSNYVVRGYGTVNFAAKGVPHTRVTNYSEINQQPYPSAAGKGPLLCFEFPQASGDPFYPLPTEENRIRYEAYRTFHQEKGDRNVIFAGRLGTYSYLNMDQACAQGLMVAKQILDN